MEPAHIRRKFGLHASTGLVSSILTKALAIAQVKVLTIYLPIDEYGVLSIWLYFVGLAQAFSTSIFSASLWRFMQRRRNNNFASASSLIVSCIFGSFLFFSILFSSLIMLFCLTGFQIVNDPNYLSALAIIFCLTSFYILKELITVISGTEQNSREILSFNFAFSLSAFLTAFLFAYIYGNYILVLIGLCAAYLIPVILTIIIKGRQYGAAKPKISDLRESMQFGGPGIITASVVSLVPYLASYSVGFWLGDIEMATFSIAITLAGLFTFTVTPFLVAHKAYLIKSFESDNRDDGLNTTGRIMEMFAMISIPVALIIIGFSPLFIILISTEEYLNATLLIPFAVVATLFQLYSYFWKVRIELAEKMHLAAIAHAVSALVMVLLCFTLIPLIGLIGVGIVLIAQSGTVLLLTILLAHSLISIPLRRGFATRWIIAIFALVASFLMLSYLSLPEIATFIGSCFVYFLILKLSGILTYDDLKQIFSLVTGRQI